MVNLRNTDCTCYFGIHIASGGRPTPVFRWFHPRWSTHNPWRHSWDSRPRRNGRKCNLRKLDSHHPADRCRNCRQRWYSEHRLMRSTPELLMQTSMYEKLSSLKLCCMFLSMTHRKPQENDFVCTVLPISILRFKVAIVLALPAQPSRSFNREPAKFW